MFRPYDYLLQSVEKQMYLLVLHKSYQTMLVRFLSDLDPTIVMQLLDQHYIWVILEKLAAVLHCYCWNNLCAVLRLDVLVRVMMIPVLVVALRDMEENKNHRMHDTEVVHPWTVEDMDDTTAVAVAVPSTAPLNPYGDQM